jgi:hypothetical protein
MYEPWCQCRCSQTQSQSRACSVRGASRAPDPNATRAPPPRQPSQADAAVLHVPRARPPQETLKRTRGLHDRPEAPSTHTQDRRDTRCVRLYIKAVPILGSHVILLMTTTEPVSAWAMAGCGPCVPAPIALSLFVSRHAPWLRVQTWPPPSSVPPASTCLHHPRLAHLRFEPWRLERLAASGRVWQACLAGRLAGVWASGRLGVWVTSGHVWHV